MRLRLATWNINSIRLRIETVRAFVDACRPDVLCLQEIKVQTEDFPAEPLAEMGFVHQRVRGMKGYNGVAILSRVPLEDAGQLDWCGRDDSRHIAARIDGGVELHNFYVPAGGDVPDPEENDKFAHKLQFVEEMTAWGEGLDEGKRILVGDLNIAPLETDVWSHKQLLSVVSHTPAETERFAKAMAAHCWVDAVRHFIPPEEPLYTWWSYRNRTWPGSDRGRRLDHVWATKSLVPALRGAMVARETRGWGKTSDHVPVLVDFEL